MKRFLRSQGVRNLVVIAVVIFLGILTAAFTHNSSSPLTSALGTVFLPLQKLSAAISENLGELSVSFRSASVYEEENRELKKELEEYRKKLANYDILRNFAMSLHMHPGAGA